MQIGRKFDFSTLALYILFGFAFFCLLFIGDQAEPYGLALLYALLFSGFSPIACVCLYPLSALLMKDFLIFFLYLGQAVLLALGFFLQSRITKDAPTKSGFFPLLALSLSLALFVAFAPFQAYPLPFENLENVNPLMQKVLLSALLFLLSAAFAVGLKGMTKKLLRCRLRNDEILFSVLFFVLIGVGICRFLSVNAYMGISFFILLLFAFVTKDALCLLCSFVLSLPPLLTVGLSPERYFAYGVAVALFVKSGRLATAFSLLAVFFLYGYFDGLYDFATQQLVASVLSATIPCFLFILLPAPIVRELENKLVFYREKHLSRIAINRNRAAVGKQLFEISAVFREIECAFSSLGSEEAEQAAKRLMCATVMEETCRKCPHFSQCAKEQVHAEIVKLIDVGCLKGKTNLIDVPRLLGEYCVDQSGILYAVNKQLSEYKKYMTETENAANGRALLAGQAQGVSEILKNLALEQSEPLRIYTDKERALSVALSGAGIVCSEVLVYGEEENPTLSLITYGNADVKKIAAIASYQFGATMIISEKLPLNQNKFCCILRKKPQYDAAFGVATAKKSGETASGDTHSVIRIDERNFLVALSDGMGSGEYARRVSENTMSLLESFYRAKMPSALVLPTVNKLLTFNKEETFACVDVALVNLDDGKADVIKIGSPVAFILSGHTVKVLESNSLPMGILDTLRPETASYELNENDVLLFLSDGVVDAFGSTTDLYETLRTIPAKNPQQLADSLLERAMISYGGVAKDDMTAVAVRLFKPLPAA